MESNASEEGWIPVESLNLSEDEARAYPRWYTDLLVRKGKQSVAIGDILTFVENFGIKPMDKEKILDLFGKPLVTLDPSQFYVFLRLTSHLIEGQTLSDSLMYIPASVPKPKSILSKKRKESSSNGDKPNGSSVSQHGNPFRKRENNGSADDPKSAKPKLDIDAFKTFILTGARPHTPSEPPKKKVTFNNGPPQVAEAAARSMEELLRQRPINSPMMPTNNARSESSDNARNYDITQYVQSGPSLFYPSLQYEDNNSPDGDSGDEEGNHDIESDDDDDDDNNLDDLDVDTTTFKNVTIDSFLHHGSRSPNLPRLHLEEANSPSSSPPPPPMDTQHTSRKRLPPPLPPKVRMGSPSPLNPSEPFMHIPSSALPQSSSLDNFQPLIPTPTGPVQVVPTFQRPEPPPSRASYSSTTMPLPAVNPAYNGTQLRPEFHPSPSHYPIPPSRTFSPPVPFPGYPRMPSASDFLPRSTPPLPPPRPPQPRKTSTSNSNAVPTIVNNRLLPPPPPPLRRRAPSLPPSLNPNAHSYFVGSPLASTNSSPGGRSSPLNHVTGPGSSAPDLLADIHSLDNQVTRLHFNQ